MKKYLKPKKNHQELIELLKSRGLIIRDDFELSELRNALKKVGYYRFSGYCLPFQINSGYQKHNFRQNVDVTMILRRYRFDLELSKLIFNALSDIEVAFRTNISEFLLSISAMGPHWHIDASLFAKNHYDFIKKVSENCGYDWDSQKKLAKTDFPIFIKHYYDNYNDPAIPPAWMMIECTSFRTWAIAYENLKDPYKKQIADNWRYLDGTRITCQVLENWMHSIAILRNRCAHHSRITGRVFPFPPIIPSNMSAKSYFGTSTSDLRSLILVIIILLKSANPRSIWPKQLYNLFGSYSSDVNIFDATKIPLNNNGSWDSDQIWSI